MTPAARINAAIGLIDRIVAGELADRALAAWGRKNRYAGSKDRAAIADLVYCVLRRKRSLASLGGGESGRKLLLGYLREAGEDPEAIFGVGPYGPSPLTDLERSGGQIPQPDSGESADFPEWLWRDIQDSQGDKAREIAKEMQSRAPVHLRVNLARLSRQDVIAELSTEGIITRPHQLSPSAVEVVEGARKIKNSRAYLEGAIELQDASSQGVADMVPLEAGQTLLDFCAGGGGKTLAVAGRVRGSFFAHDVDPGRMKDLPARAERAKAIVACLSLSEVEQRSPFDTVLVDAPCSGSGSWRRDPQGKWLLTREKLCQLLEIQREILSECVRFVRPKGHLVYATCSLLDYENGHQIKEFVAHHAEFSLASEKKFTPLDGGDGFYCAVLKRN